MVQFWRFATGPNLSKRGLFFKVALPIPNVEKCDQSVQHGSGSCRSPKTALGCTLSTLAICDRSGPVKQRPFFSKLLCLALMSRNVTKADQHGSGSRRSPKHALGSTLSILAIPDRSGHVKQMPYFQSFSA